MELTDVSNSLIHCNESFDVCPMDITNNEIDVSISDVHPQSVNKKNNNNNNNETQIVFDSNQTILIQNVKIH